MVHPSKGLARPIRARPEPRNQTHATGVASLIVKKIPALLKMAVLCSVTVFLMGCGGGDAPTPTTPEKFEEAQNKQKDMIRKEYGSGYAKGSKKKS